MQIIPVSFFFKKNHFGKQINLIYLYSTLIKGHCLEAALQKYRNRGEKLLLYYSISLILRY